jgi:peptide deformylase|tara:strand:- start:737 stop:1357 length:621 start_codon:yes stop_codon:yes gene_type:complete
MYQLIEEASKILRTPPAVFDFEVRADAKEVEERLSEAMDRFGGIGLSANQVGLDARVFMMRTQDGNQAFFNPELIKMSQETDLMKEGCLSFPDIYLMIKRSKVIELKYQDAEGNTNTTMLDGLGSRCAQHEVDHLNGIIFLQRASQLKIERALKSRPKERKKRLDYEKRQAVAKYIQSVQSAKDADADGTGIETLNTLPQNTSASS